MDKMSFKELLKAMIYKIEESEEEAPKTNGWVVGAKVKRRKRMGSCDYFEKGMIGTIHKIHTVLGIDVILPDGKLSRGNAKSCLELVTEPELKLGDTVKIVRNYCYSGKDPEDIVGKEGIIIEVINHQTYPYRVRMDSGLLISVSKVEKITKPKEEWKDITTECEFRIKTDSSGLHWFDISHKEHQIGRALNMSCVHDSFIIGIELPNRIDYKIEMSEQKESNHFKILKKGGK